MVDTTTPEKFKCTRWECGDCGEVVAEGRDRPPETCKTCVRFAERARRSPPLQEWIPLWTTEDLVRVGTMAYADQGLGDRSLKSAKLLVDGLVSGPVPEHAEVFVVHDPTEANPAQRFLRRNRESWSVPPFDFVPLASATRFVHREDAERFATHIRNEYEARVITLADANLLRSGT